MKVKNASEASLRDAPRSLLPRSGTAQTLRCVVGVAQGREEAALTDWQKPPQQTPVATSRWLRLFATTGYA
ncbi:MAG: hypothetical protein V7L29_32705 [Nostoc sp.]|uniref:hypothetical protein n=1 Tax=Nostoc sp. TaxID=1180 RepID=UPI002FF79A1E